METSKILDPSLSSTTNTFPSSSLSRKPFKFYRNVSKKVCDSQGFQILIKNHKSLKAFEIKEYRLPFPHSADNSLLQEETLKYLRKIMKQNKSLSTLKFFIHGTEPVHIHSILSFLKNLRCLVSKTSPHSLRFTSNTSVTTL